MSVLHVKLVCITVLIIHKRNVGLETKVRHRSVYVYTQMHYLYRILKVNGQSNETFDSAVCDFCT